VVSREGKNRSYSEGLKLAAVREYLEGWVTAGICEKYKIKSKRQCGTG